MISSSEMREFPCPVCGSAGYRVCYPDTLQGESPSFDYNFEKNFNKTFRLVRCEECGHMYASPRPMDLFRGYSSNQEDDIYIRAAAQRRATAKAVLKEMVAQKKEGRLLDIGCATGDFLWEARQFFRAEGLELSKWSSAIAQSRGLTVHEKLLEELSSNEKFDVITLWGVIEHLEFPEAVVKEIHQHLNPGGLVFLWTGNVDSLPAKVLGKKWWYYQGQHIQMFTRKSLAQLFVQNGFGKVFLKTYPYVANIESLSNSLSRYPFLARIFGFFFKKDRPSSFEITLKVPGEMFACFRKGL